MVGQTNGNGTVQVSHGIQQKGIADRRLKMGEAVLRFFMLALAVVTAVLVGTDRQTQRIFALEKEAKFNDMKSLVFLVVMNGIVASYSLMQGLRCVVSMYTGSLLLSKPLAWTIFTCDQIMAYFALAAAAAAAETAYLAKRGQSEFQWLKICDFYGKFCNRIGEGIFAAFIVTVSLVVVSGMSAYHLFRLYGPKDVPFYIIRSCERFVIPGNDPVKYGDGKWLMLTRT